MKASLRAAAAERVSLGLRITCRPMDTLRVSEVDLYPVYGLGLVPLFGLENKLFDHLAGTPVRLPTSPRSQPVAAVMIVAKRVFKAGLCAITAQSMK